MPAWVLKAAASMLTLLAAAGSVAYVGGHLKSAAAPLHPQVAAGGHRTFPFWPGASDQAQAGTTVRIGPSVQVGGSQAALTYTSVS